MPANSSKSSRRPHFSVLHEEVDDDGVHHLLIKYKKHNGGFGEHRIRRGQLEEPRSAKIEFADRGAIMPNDWPEQLRQLKECRAPVRRITARADWYDNALATRHGVLGHDTITTVFADGPFTQEARRQGKYRSAAASLAPILEKSDILIFMLLLGLVPALASRISRTGGFGVCLVGESSTGKTLALRTAHSVVDRAEESDLPSFGHTTGTILDSLPSFGSLCMCFGDVKAELNERAMSEKLRTLAFTIPGGTPRMRKGEKPPRRPSFMIAALSAERSLKKIFTENGVVYEDGEAVRMIELPIPSRDAGGIFVDVNGDTAPLAAALTTVLSQQHGTLLPKFVRSFAKLSPTIVSTGVARWEAQFLSSLGELPPHHARVAKQFALIAATGRVAVKRKCGVLALSRKRVDTAVRRMLDRALNGMRQAQEEEIAPWHKLFALIDALPVEANCVSHATRSDSFLGFRRGTGGTEILLRGTSVEAEIQGVSFLRNMVPELDRRGCLKRSSNGEASSHVKRQGLGRHRYHVFDSAALARARAEILG